MATTTTTTTTTSTAVTWDSDEWEIVNDDGFVYKRKKRRIDPSSLTRNPNPELDPAILNKERRRRRRAALLTLKEKYQREIGLWDNLSNTLKTMEDRAKSKHELFREIDADDSNGGKVQSSGHKSSQSIFTVEKHSGSLVHELISQVEAQEAIIHKFEHLCDVAESLCIAQEEKDKQHFFDLPIWNYPHELMASLGGD